MRRLLNWAREVEWFAVFALVLLVAAVALGIASIWLPAVTGTAIVLAFGALTLAFFTK